MITAMLLLHCEIDTAIAVRTQIPCAPGLGLAWPGLARVGLGWLVLFLKKVPGLGLAWPGLARAGLACPLSEESPGALAWPGKPQAGLARAGLCPLSKDDKCCAPV